MSDAESLRAQLRKSEQTFFDKFSKRITHVESLRPLFGFIGVGGTLIVALARAVDDPLGLALTIGGAVVAGAGGAMVVLMDYKKLEISQDAKDAHRIADEALDALAEKTRELEAAEATCRQAVAFDLKRLARIDATRLMIESVEAAFLNAADPKKSAQLMLRLAASRLRSAMDYKAGDFLTFTIFQKVKVRGGGEVMRPIAREWTDAHAASSLGREWKRGEGYTGRLWSLAHDDREVSIVEPDTQRPAAQYRVENADPAREARYRSVASFPILIGSQDDIWGVVTATSDRAGVFDHVGDLARQSVETVRDIAMVASLLAKLRP